MDDHNPPQTDNNGPEDPPKPEENTLTNPQFEALREAIQILYIRGNQSGRIYFNKEWPDVAAYILGKELIDIDTQGSNDYELRKELEEEAEERQFALSETFETLEDNSVKSGILQTEYVEGVVQSLGRDLSLMVYTDKIVDRFAPAGAEPEPEVAVEVSAPEDVEEVTPEAVPAPPVPAQEDARAPRSVSGFIEVKKPV